MFGCVTSGERSDTNAADRIEVLPIAGHESEPVFEGGGRDERVGQARSELSHDPPGPFRYRSVDLEFTERSEQLCGQVGRLAAGVQLGPRDHGVVQAVTLRSKLMGSTKVVDEDV